MARVLDERERRALVEGINSTRDEIASTIGDLKGLMNESLDWRTWIRRHPWSVMAGAALIGFRLGRGRWV